MEAKKADCSHFVEFDGQGVKSVKTGFKHAVKLAKLTGESYTAYVASHGGNLAHAGRRRSVGSCGVSWDVGGDFAAHVWSCA